MSHRSERRGFLVGSLLAALLIGALSSAGCQPKTTRTPPSKPKATVTSPTPSPAPTGAPAPTPTPTATPSPKQVRVTLYFPMGETLAAAQEPVPSSGGIALDTLRRLVRGPNATERSAGMTTTIPKGTKVLGVRISNGVATADFSGPFESGGGTLSMRMRLAEVVFTLTQFRSVHGVRFAIDGKTLDTFGGEGIIIDRPQTRADFEDLLAAVFIESPGVRSIVSSPLRVHGTANTFEGVFFLALEDASHRTIVQKRMQTSGTGTRGTFDTTLSWTRGSPSWIVGYYFSAKDGSKVIATRYPLGQR